jgi:hypothetical protein
LPSRVPTWISSSEGVAPLSTVIDEIVTPSASPTSIAAVPLVGVSVA